MKLTIFLFHFSLCLNMANFPWKLNHGNHMGVKFDGTKEYIKSSKNLRCAFCLPNIIYGCYLFSLITNILLLVISMHKTIIKSQTFTGFFLFTIFNHIKGYSFTLSHFEIVRCMLIFIGIWIMTNIQKRL